MSLNIKLAMLASVAVLSAPAMAWESANDRGRLRHFTNTIDLNMRAWPAPVSQIVATLPQGSQMSADRCIHPEGLQDDWCHVVSTSSTGWVDAAYLQEIRPSNADAAAVANANAEAARLTAEANAAKAKKDALDAQAAAAVANANAEAARLTAEANAAKAKKDALDAQAAAAVANANAEAARLTAEANAAKAKKDALDAQAAADTAKANAEAARLTAEANAAKAKKDALDAQAAADTAKANAEAARLTAEANAAKAKKDALDAQAAADAAAAAKAAADDKAKHDAADAAKANAEAARLTAEANAAKAKKDALDAQAGADAAAAAKAAADDKAKHDAADARLKADAEAAKQWGMKVDEARTKGTKYAEAVGTKWSLSEINNPMIDDKDYSVTSVQLNKKGAVAKIEGTCRSPGQVTFVATLEDNEDTNSPLGLPDFAAGYVAGNKRINDDVAFPTRFQSQKFRNTVVLATLTSQHTADSIETTWRILAEVETARGRLIMQIPTFDANVQKLLVACGKQYESAKKRGGLLDAPTFTQ